MSKIADLPYAGWLEQSLQDMVSKPVTSICLITKTSSGEVRCGYFDCSMTDKILFAGYIQQDAMFDAMESTGLIDTNPIYGDGEETEGDAEQIDGQ